DVPGHLRWPARCRRAECRREDPIRARGAGEGGTAAGGRPMTFNDDERRCGGTGMVAYWDGSAYAGEMCRGCVDCEGPDDLDGHDTACESELTSHGYTPCRCRERAQ